ncbi:MAG: S24 family peptidase [Pseudomonadota bacterium]|nr:S24 family peptidase [Pseudomonadota bacterium]
MKKDTEIILGRLEARITELGISERKACLLAGLKVDSVRQIRRGFAPKVATLLALSKALEVPVSYFTSGIDFAEEGADDPADQILGYVSVPTLETRAGMGGGGFGDEDMLNGPTMLPERLIRTELRGEPTDFVVMEVEGQSMQPTLESGDQVLVDRRKKNPSNGGLFALWDGFGIVVKWVERVANSNPPSLRIASENKVFQPYEILAEEANIIGRIVWYARKL